MTAGLAFLDEIRRRPLLSPGEEVALARRIERGDPEARRRLIEANLRLVVSLAARFAGVASRCSSSSRRARSGS